MTTDPSTRLWQHQRAAVDAATAMLTHHGRATVVSACGTGKTLVAAEVARRLVPSGTTVVFVPTLHLLAQTAEEWALYLGEGLGRLVAVCSDEQATYGADQARGNLARLRATVTTDADTVAAILRADRPGRRLTILATYTSLPVVCSASQGSEFDLVVVDEAHRTAGAAGRPWAAVHDDQRLPARRRLYMTATPRIVTGDTAETASMDDTAVFGPEVFRLSFSEAIEMGLLADYQVVVSVVDPTRYTAPTDTDASGTRLRASQIALLRALREYGIRRAMTFHSRVASARWFAETMPAAVGLLPPDERPGAAVDAAWVSGATTSSRRRQAVDRLRDPGDDIVVVANARVFGEGVDVPALDGVAFIDPRTSTTDVVQAVGRALRTGGRPGKIATILVPAMLLDEDGGTAADDTAWATVWRVVRALRAHDDRLDDRLEHDRHRLRTAGEVPTQRLFHVSGDLPAGTAEAIRVRLLEEAVSAWSASYAKAAAFHAEHGHLRAPSGSEVANWLAEQRRRYRSGHLVADRVARLEVLGIVWSPREAAWEENLADAALYVEEFGHLSVPRDHPLSKFLTYARGERRTGRISPGHAAALDELGIDWEPREEGWVSGYAKASAFFAEHGHLRVPPGHDDVLKSWVAYYRARWVAGTIAPDRVGPLESIGMKELASMPAKLVRWWEVYDELAEIHRGEGGLSLSAGTSHAKWVVHQRQRRRAGKLTADQIAALEALGIDWNPARGGRQPGAARRPAVQ